jgi:hypothetical protein
MLFSCADRSRRAKAIDNKAIDNLDEGAFSDSDDNRSRSLPNYAGRRNRSHAYFDRTKRETSWPFSIFSEPTNRLVAL